MNQKFKIKETSKAVINNHLKTKYYSPMYRVASPIDIYKVDEYYKSVDCMEAS